MNTYYISDENFLNSDLYKEFINANPTSGTLKIRAYAANQAIPISGLNIVVSTLYKGNNIIFFEGVTNNSGIIEGINLPAPRLDLNNLDAPNKTSYQITATSSQNNINQIYRINMYENISVIQNINIVPNSTFEVGEL